MARCIECGTEVESNEDVEVGEILECQECGVDLEVVSLDPLQLALAPEEEEDWGE